MLKLKSFFGLLMRHPLSLAGTAITTAAAIIFLVFFSLDLAGLHGHPYVGILTYLVVPAIFVAGLLLIPIGLRQARKRAAPAGAELPVIDFNREVVRNRFLVFVVLTTLNVVIVAVASYKAVEVMDTTAFCGEACHSVMAPEHTALKRGAHASVSCVECHIGPGAGWFVKSKLSGSWQVVSVNLDLYPRPIPTPVHSLRPARETCEQCHWPQKFVGDRLKVVTKYAEDEANTEKKTVLLMRVGGIEGRVSKGIHWHVDPANRIRYRSDESREEIHEVELTGPGGEVERWFAPGADEGEKASAGTWRQMDCVDCHNRPSHTFHSPEQEVDRALQAGAIARDLPFVRREGLKLIRAEYADAGAARAGIRAGLESFYAAGYPEVARGRAADLDAAAAALFEGWSSNVFPQMSVTWGTYPNHIGHEQAPGCWRCHDDQHTSKSGRTISQDCETCHSLLAEEEQDPEILRTLSP
ncbi:MAG: cytochrome c family protein [Acidobacteria bacterium]|nr:cytochrome c family protein [Acidobacteriota bacterium]